MFADGIHLLYGLWRLQTISLPLILFRSVTYDTKMDLSARSVDRANSLITFLVSANAVTSEIFLADYNLCILMAEFILGENINQVESTAASQTLERVEMIYSERIASA